MECSAASILMSVVGKVVTMHFTPESLDHRRVDRVTCQHRRQRAQNTAVADVDD